MEQDQFDCAHGLSSAEVSDALDYFGLPGSAPGLMPVAGPPRLFGPAFTVRFGPVDSAQPGTVGDYLDDIPAGSVAVLDNAGRPDCTVWGGIMSQLAAHRAVAGTVVHGVCRDTDEADTAGYALFALGRFMRTGKDRVQVDAVGGAVTVAGVRVAPGDIVVADQDGVVFVPAGRAAEVFERARAMQAVELRIVAAALDGMPLAEARREFGYLTLQRQPASDL